MYCHSATPVVMTSHIELADFIEELSLDSRHENFDPTVQHHLIIF